MNARIGTVLILAAAMILGACSTPPPLPMESESGVGAPQQNQPPDQTVGLPMPGNGGAAQPTSMPVEHEHDDSHEHSDVDLHHLPVGDGRVSTTGAQVGYVYSCGDMHGMSGAYAAGDWFNGDGTYDLTEKPTVDGSVTWPSTFNISLSGDVRVFTGNNLPDHSTGRFPIASSDDAYQYDRNPNSISDQQLQIEVPADPTLAAQPTCLTGGPIGVMLSGVVFYNALDAAGLDAAAHEIQDACGGHPQMSGQYHYHSYSECLDDAGTGHSPLIGYAFDGFGIYGLRGEDESLLTNANLDDCHGHTHVIEWDGQRVEMYHYHATYEYPYTIGCFRGTPTRTGGQGGGMPGNVPRDPRP